MSPSNTKIFQYSAFGPGVSNPEWKEIEMTVRVDKKFPTLQELFDKITEVFRENLPSFELKSVQCLYEGKERTNVYRSIDVILMHRRVFRGKITLLINNLDPENNSSTAPSQAQSTQMQLMRPPRQMPEHQIKINSTVNYGRCARTPYIGGGQYQSKAFTFARDRTPLPPDNIRSFRGGRPKDELQSLCKFD